MDGRGENVVIDTGIILESVIFVGPVVLNVGAECALTDNCAVTDGDGLKLIAIAEGVRADLGVIRDLDGGDSGVSEGACADVLDSRKIGSCIDARVYKRVVADVGELAEFNAYKLFAICKRIVG